MCKMMLMYTTDDPSSATLSAYKALERKSITTQLKQTRRTYPKNPGSAGGCNNGFLWKSAVLNCTVLPHHAWMVLIPTCPRSGKSTVKKMMIWPMARPESGAADRTSVKRINIVSSPYSKRARHVDMWKRRIRR